MAKTKQKKDEEREKLKEQFRKIRMKYYPNVVKKEDAAKRKAENKKKQTKTGKPGIPKSNLYEKYWKVENPTEWFINKRGKRWTPSVAEERIAAFLHSLELKFEREVSFRGLKGNWGAELRVDFYLPERNVVIEYDGKNYHKNNVNDLAKNAFCKNFNITLLRFNNKNWQNLEMALLKALKN